MQYNVSKNDIIVTLFYSSHIDKDYMFVLRNYTSRTLHINEKNKANVIIRKCTLPPHNSEQFYYTNDVTLNNSFLGQAQNIKNNKFLKVLWDGTQNCYIHEENTDNYYINTIIEKNLYKNILNLDNVQLNQLIDKSTKLLESGSKPKLKLLINCDEEGQTKQFMTGKQFVRLNKEILKELNEERKLNLNVMEILDICRLIEHCNKQKSC